MARSLVRTRELRLLVEGRGWHAEARPCTEEEGRETGAMGFYRVRTGSNQRGAARMCRKRQFNSDLHTAGAWVSSSAAARDLSPTLYLGWYVKQCDIDRTLTTRQNISIQVSRRGTDDGEGCCFWALWSKLAGWHIVPTGMWARTQGTALLGLQPIGGDCSAGGANVGQFGS